MHWLQNMLLLLLHPVMCFWILIVALVQMIKLGSRVMEAEEYNEINIGTIATRD